MLKNGDSFELSEYVEKFASRLKIARYNYHWQNDRNQLIKRWDNVKHHRQIKTYPHHLHDGQGNIFPSTGININSFLKQVEQYIDNNEQNAITEEG